MDTYNVTGGYTSVGTSDTFTSDGQIIDHTEFNETYGADGEEISGTVTITYHQPTYKKIKKIYVKGVGYQEVSAAPQHQLHFWTVAIPVIAVTAIVVPLTVGHSSSTNDTNALSVHRLLNFSFQIRR